MTGSRTPRERQRTHMQRARRTRRNSRRTEVGKRGRNPDTDWLPADPSWVYCVLNVYYTVLVEIDFEYQSFLELNFKKGLPKASNPESGRAKNKKNPIDDPKCQHTLGVTHPLFPPERRSYLKTWGSAHECNIWPLGVLDPSNVPCTLSQLAFVSCDL